jgi:LmbE family N-acetylglucosaminyl deacetylase
MADDSTEGDIDDGVERILVVMAHPDDVDFGSAGSIATWTDAGIEVEYCIVTDGDAGGFDREVPRHVMAETRRAEQTAAAKVVGVTELHFLGHPDGRLESTLDLRRDISRVIRQVRPQRVVGQSPERSYERIFASHPDHLATGEATLCAVYPDARNPFAHPELLDHEGLEPWTVGEVWIGGAPTRPPDRFVDITDVFDRKVEALLCHVSQHPEPEALEDLLRGWSTMLAEAAGYPLGRLAEGYFRVATA